MPRIAYFSPVTLNSIGCLAGIWRPPLQVSTFAKVNPIPSCLFSVQNYYTPHPSRETVVINASMTLRY